MKLISVRQSDLGSCWLPALFLQECHKCSRYDKCKYPERVANVEYDALRERRRQTKEALDALDREIAGMRE